MTRVTRGGSVSLAAMSCDMLGLLELLAISLLHFFLLLRPSTVCVHVVPMCLKTWAKVIQVKSSVLPVASSSKTLRWDK